MQYIHSSTNSLFLWFHRLIDATTPTVVILLLALQSQPKVYDRYIVAGLLAGLFLTFIAQVNGTYTDWRGRSLLASLRKISTAWLLSWLGLVAIAFVMKISESFSREVWLLWLVLTPATLITYRIALRLTLGQLRRRGIGNKNVLIVGAGVIGKRLANTLTDNPWMGYTVIGFLDDNELLVGTTPVNNIKVLSTVDACEQHCDSLQIDEVFICLPKRAEERVRMILDKLASTPIVAKYVPDIFSFNLLHSKMEMYAGLPVVSVFDTPLSSRTNKLIKRLEDIALSSIILVMISPIMLALAVGVKLSSPGPVFYRQTRITESNRPFEMMKFRSMPVNTDAGGAVWGNADKKTNTRFGQFIRKTSLDELPQFINVLRGEMSIVGPRPERDVFVEKFRDEIPRYMQKHMVKAGITGLAQVSGLRGDTCLKTRVEYDLRYIAEWSVSLDIKIILKTIGKVFQDSTAK